MIRRRSFLLAGAGTLAVTACGEPEVANVEEPLEWNGTHLDGGPDLPDITLTDTTGAQVSLRDDIAAPVMALFFGYTNCPDVCPGILADMATARRRVEGVDPADIALVLITTDPARDTPEALGTYLERVDQDFIGLTGDLDVIVSAAESLGISITDGKQLESGGYEVDHSSQVLGFGKARTMSLVWSDVAVGEMRSDLERLVASNDG